jgi:hydroxymethylpyrimidine/phosphomethylpyrimidine kinase
MNLHRDAQVTKPALVLVGGIDPGGGAGVLRDLLTAVELGAQATVVATCVTDQDKSRVSSIEARAGVRVRQSLGRILSAMQPSARAVKIGMVATAEVAGAIADALNDFAGPVVYDPVLRASSGGSLYDGDRAAVIALARRATVLTPNLGEAAWLLDRPVTDLPGAESAAQDLVALGVPAVLVKGGHLAGDATDVLLDDHGQRLLSSSRVPGPSPRGTGCALATAIAAHLALGAGLGEAVAAAKGWLTGKIAGATRVGDEWHL